MTVSVGVIGLGPMGLSLAQRLQETGFDVVATSRREQTRREARAQGVRTAESPAEVSRWLRERGGKSVLLTSLPGGPVVRQALLGEHGAITDGDHFVVVDTSTCAPADSRALAAELRARGCPAVDAPVSGGPTAARAGTLSVMAGGDAEDLSAAEEVLQAVAARLVVCGGPGAGQVAKACNQLVVTANIAVVAEALVTAKALGADPAAVREALLGGYAASRILELHGERMLNRDFSLGAAARTQFKDIGIIRELTDGVADNQVFEAAARIMQELVESGGSELDHSAAVQVVERRTGVSLAD